jgi:hypothetical protein
LKRRKRLSKYRPEEWVNPYAEPIRRNVTWNKEVIESFEAGADAMLEALRSQGNHTTYVEGLRGHIKNPGTRVFIPDDPTPYAARLNKSPE